MKSREPETNDSSSEEMETEYSPSPTDVLNGDRPDTDSVEETKRREIPRELDYLILGKYRLVKLLGKGGMGSIYLAEHTELRKLVAIKIISEKLSHRPQFLELFKREARSAARLQHPNIARVFDYGEERGKCFYVMDYVEGASLGEIIESSGPLPVKRSLGIFKQIVAALGHAHKSGIIHRDVKPSNVLIDHGGSAKLLDFGLARSIYGEDSLTATGQSPGGTPSYVSPEQRKGEPTDARTDIYSAGVTLFEMLTNTLPRDVTSPRERLQSVLGKSLNPLQRVRASQIANMVMKCLEDADKRYRTAEEVLAEVGNIERRLQQQRWFLRSAAGAFAAAGLAVIAVLALSTPRSQASDAAKYLGRSDFPRAAKLFAKLSRKDPSDVKNMYGLGLSYVGMGRLAEAKSEFDRIAESFGDATTADEEGLARVAYARNEQGKALELFNKAVETGRDHTLLHVTIGDIYLLRNELDKAIGAYEKALARKPIFPFQLATAYSALGYVLMNKGEYEEAQKAIGKATERNPKDTLSLFLKSEVSRKADAEEQKRISALVDDLIEKAKQAPPPRPSEEVWDSKPTALSILGLKKAGLAFSRAGEYEMLMFNFARAMHERGRVSIVERDVMEKLLAELKLGTSSLAASEAAMVLGKIVPAGLIAAGTLRTEEGLLGVDIRLAETETTELSVWFSETQRPGEGITEFAGRLAKGMTEKIRQVYPLKATIVRLNGNEAVLSIGSNQGLAAGTEMKVVKRRAERVGEETVYRETDAGKLTVKRVSSDSAVAEITEGEGSVADEDKVIEIVERDT